TGGVPQLAASTNGEDTCSGQSGCRCVYLERSIYSPACMAPESHATRQRLLDATETLLRERGLAGAGIHQVVARSGAPIGSVYHFFPRGKTQLVAEALQLQAEKARALFQSILADKAEPP